MAAARSWRASAGQTGAVPARDAPDALSAGTPRARQHGTKTAAAASKARALRPWRSSQRTGRGISFKTARAWHRRPSPGPSGRPVRRADPAADETGASAGRCCGACAAAGPERETGAAGPGRIIGLCRARPQGFCQPPSGPPIPGAAVRRANHPHALGSGIAPQTSRPTHPRVVPQPVISSCARLHHLRDRA